MASNNIQAIVNIVTFSASAPFSTDSFVFSTFFISISAAGMVIVMMVIGDSFDDSGGGYVGDGGDGGDDGDDGDDGDNGDEGDELMMVVMLTDASTHSSGQSPPIWPFEPRVVRMIRQKWKMARLVILLFN